jgi:hypothetical protein
MSLSRDSLVFDPCGDVFILLERTDDRTDLGDTSGVRVALVDDAPADDAPADDAPADDAPVDDAPANYAPANDTPANDACAHDVPIDGALETRADSPSAKISIREVEFRVSSRHLSLASKVFGHNFLGKSLEHDSSTDRDLVTIPLLKDNFHAMVILLNIGAGLSLLCAVPRNGPGVPGNFFSSWDPPACSWERFWLLGPARAFLGTFLAPGNRPSVPGSATSSGELTYIRFSVYVTVLQLRRIWLGHKHRLFPPFPAALATLFPISTFCCVTLAAAQCDRRRLFDRHRLRG